jgi:hypothetical protein
VGQSVRPATREEKMETLLKFAKELLPLLQLYPGWAKLLFTACALMCAASVATFAVLYQDAEKRMDERTVASDLSVNLGVLTQPARAPEIPPDAPLHSPGEGRNGIEVSIAQPVSLASQRDGDISYVLERTNGGLRIRPSVGYLSRLATGGPISDLSYWYSPFTPVLPVVDLKVVNNSSKTIFFTNATLEVEQSRMDPTPILLIPRDKDASNAQHILLVNDGWGSIDECLLRFNLVPDGQPPSYDGPFQNEVKAEAFAERTNVDISSAMEKAGVNNTAIKHLEGLSHGPTILREESAGRRQVSFLGPFQNNMATAQGEIVYSGGGQPGRQVKFSTRVYVTNLYLAGAPAPPTAQYDAFLQVEGDHYVVDVPISQAIKAGEFDRFTFRIAAAKSSLHRFRLKLLYNDGEIFSTTPVDLQIFIPRSTVNMFKRASKIAALTPEH